MNDENTEDEAEELEHGKPVSEVFNLVTI